MTDEDFPAGMNEETLLGILQDEKRRSIGFDLDEQLAEDREKALEYYKGEMRDVPTQPNRSKAVSTDVADTVEIVLPDVIEIFTGGEDVAAFKPVGPEDEEASKQETEYVNHVFFEQNPGFLNLYSAIKDACIEREGVLTWWWEDGEVCEEEFEGKNAIELVSAQERGELVDVEQVGEDLYSFKLRYQKPGKACVASIAPTDFTAAPEVTTDLQAATYCATRERVRAQELIRRGYDRDKVDQLQAYASPDDELDQARDRADESEETKSGGNGDLRMVEVVQHFIRLLDEETGKLKLWRVVTGNDEHVILHMEEVERIRVALLTPYIVPHRRVGESVADKMMEIQKIKTVLWRMLLDSGYFALNQRHEVAMSMANEWTISDLLRNEPNMPVRVAQAGAVKPLTAGGLNFDAFAALEQASVMGELRSGIARNAQGLNPETLHDTKAGMEKLFMAAQRRVRLIARIFAETGVKDAFLGLHAMLRKYANAATKARLSGGWVDVDPTSWGERNDMTIEIGLGASGREAEQMALGGVLGVSKELIQLQGGVDGPFINRQNVHNTLTRFARASGVKTPELHFMDPAEAPPTPPKPDPEMEKAKAQMMLEQEKAKGQLQLKAQEGEVNAALQQRKAEQDFELKRLELEAKLSMEREQIAAELQLKREQLAAEIELKRELGYAQAQVARETGMAKAQASTATSGVEPGGEPG